LTRALLPALSCGVRISCSLVLVCGALIVGLPVASKADELRWLSPPDCTNRAAVQQEVERLVGRPLAAAQAIAFDVVVQRSHEQRVTVTLRAQRRGSEQSKTRELTAGSCREAEDLAAIAIAMAITGEDESGEAPPQVRASSDVEQPPAPSRPPPAPPAPVPWSLGLGVAAAIDYGALPELAVGVEGGVAVDHGMFRVLALGAYFGRQKVLLPQGYGGEFRLALGGLLGCLQRDVGRVWLAGCAGGELGVIKAEGIGLEDPRLGDGRWSAVRAELALDWKFSPSLRLATRVGLSVPIARPEFVVEHTETVHSVAPVTLRALLGAEFLL
jgi:hypothetical protein